VAVQYDIAGQSFLVAGRPGTGKTHLMRHLAALAQTDRLAVWDPMREFAHWQRQGAHVHHPAHPKDRRAFRAFLVSVLPPAGRRSSRYDLVVIDEADMVCEAKRRLEPELEVLSQLRRHFGPAVFYVTRRPSRIHADVRETVNKLICFALAGPNDRRALDYFCEGTGVEVKRLPQHHYLVSDGAEYQIHSPVAVGVK